MAKARCIPLFDDQLEVVEMMTDTDLGAAIKAAMRFMRRGEASPLDGCAGMMFAMLKAQFVRDQIDAENGKSGGRPKKQETGVSEDKTPLLQNETGVTKSETNRPDSTGLDQTQIDQTGLEGVPAAKPPTRTRFVPPTVDEVAAYVQERGSNVDPQGFIDFYLSKNWMVGKSKMSDWKAACRNAESWERWSKRPSGTNAPNYDYTGDDTL